MARYAKVIVFDIDGTLANVDHRRQYVASKPKNWAAWNAGMARDTLNEDVASILDAFNRRPNTCIVLCSGRGEESRAVTEKWLEDNGVQYEHLYMRREKDYRQDSIVKVELLEQIRYDYGNPWLWFDDRQQVVDAIRAQGIRVCQVAPGDF